MILSTFFVLTVIWSYHLNRLKCLYSVNPTFALKNQGRIEGVDAAAQIPTSAVAFFQFCPHSSNALKSKMTKKLKCDHQSGHFYYWKLKSRRKPKNTKQTWGDNSFRKAYEALRVIIVNLTVGRSLHDNGIWCHCLYLLIQQTENKYSFVALLNGSLKSSLGRIVFMAWGLTTVSGLHGIHRAFKHGAPL